MIDRKPRLDKLPDAKLQTKLDIIEFQVSQALPATAAYMAEILG